MFGAMRSMLGVAALLLKAARILAWSVCRENSPIISLNGNDAINHVITAPARRESFMSAACTDGRVPALIGGYL